MRFLRCSGRMGNPSPATLRPLGAYSTPIRPRIPRGSGRGFHGHSATPAGRGRRRDSAPTGVPGARHDLPTEGRSRFHRRSAPPGAATWRRGRGRPSRAGIAEGIRLLPGFREHAAISQPRVGAGFTGDPRRQARQPGTAGEAGPVGPGSPKGFGSYRGSGSAPRFPNRG